ncbi:MAG: 2-ketoarginine methyltransferase [Pseudomonadota bacterium]
MIISLASWTCVASNPPSLAESAKFENFSGCETLLVEAIQPIRMHVLATNIYHLFQTGLYDYLIKNPNQTTSQIAQHFHFDSARLDGFFEYLSNENILKKNGQEVSLTPFGHSYEKFRGWYTLLIGAYSQTFAQVGEKLKLGSGFATRDSTKVGIGSCAMSHYNAIPLQKELIALVPGNEKCLLDLGCGNAGCLVETVRDMPGLFGVGVEPDAGAFEDAQKSVNQFNLGSRITLINDSAVHAPQMVKSLEHRPNITVISFVLHEILSTQGEDGVKKFLLDIFNQFPDMHMIVIEVDVKKTDRNFMGQGYAQAYFNPYYLIHDFTDQKLMPKEYWLNLFTSLNLELVAFRTVDHQVDSTDMEMGFLLRKKLSQ